MRRWAVCDCDCVRQETAKCHFQSNTVTRPWSVYCCIQITITALTYSKGKHQKSIKSSCSRGSLQTNWTDFWGNKRLQSLHCTSASPLPKMQAAFIRQRREAGCQESAPLVLLPRCSLSPTNKVYHSWILPLFAYASASVESAGGKCQGRWSFHSSAFL